jgi:dipeptidase D
MRADSLTDQEITNGVLEQFQLFCSVAHGSGNEEAISHLLFRWLERRGLSPVMDATMNIICDIPSTPGLEHIPLTIVQGHTDMVAVAAPDSGFDPRRDPITTVTEGAVLHTDGRSSLGADCGLGIAAMLYLVKLQIPHGPLRLLLTTREEDGLRGAKALSPQALDGAKCLINLDGFCFGKVVISSAGGIRQKFTHTFPTRPVTGGQAWHIQVAGFPGGHSGFDIDRVHDNAIRTLTDYLAALPEPWALAAMDAGVAFNAIPADGSAVIVCSETPPVADHVTVTPAELPETVIVQAARDLFLKLLQSLPHGVFSRHPLVRTAPGLSCNLGRAVLQGGAAEVRTFVRCCDDEAGLRLAAAITETATEAGFSETRDTYPSWPGARRNPLATAFCQAFRHTGVPYEVDALHVGLEPSVFHGMRPDLHIVSVGMEIHNAHSTSEEVVLTTVAPFIRAMDHLLEGYV